MDAPKIEIRTIKETINNINDIYFLPDIQRDFRWDEKRVIDLFDSVMKGFPIGTVMLWKQHVGNYNKGKYSFYHFIEKVKQTDNSGEELKRPAILRGKKNLYGVLDGQQRLTAFYLAIRGGYQVWHNKGRHPRTTPPLRELYFSPAGRSGKTFTTKNDFRFFSAKEVKSDCSWYKVKDIFSAKSADEFCKKTGSIKSRKRHKSGNYTEK